MRLFYISTIACLLCLFSGYTTANAQDKLIKGTVQDENSQPLPGCVISVKGTQIGVASDVDGKFSITVPKDQSILVFTFMGKKTREVTVTASATITIKLQPSQSALDEVVVIGYGTVKRRDLTGSVSSVSGEDLRKSAPVDIISALQGRAAGVMVKANDGAPGAGLNIQIRGANSFSSSNPLYVIDGIPFGGSNGSNTPSSSGGSLQRVNALAAINPNDIESIEILKDASATAIYGSRGANGVVIITTKRGKIGPDKVEYFGNISSSQPTKKLKVLNAYEFALMRNEGQRTANALSGGNEQLPFDGEMHFYPIANKFIRAPLPEDFIGKGTNWQDVIFQKALTQNHTVTVSGGSAAGNHLLSLSYVKQEGIITGSEYEKFTLRTNLNRNIKEWLVVGTNILFSRENNNFVKTNTNDNTFAAGVTRSALTYPPTVNVIDSITNTETEIANLVNPYLYISKMYNEVKGTQIFTSSYFEASLLKGLKFRQNIGYGLYNGKRDEYIPTMVSIADKGIAYVSMDNWQAITSESVLNYLHTFNKKHNLGVTAGTTFEKWVSESRYNKVSNFPSDFFLTNNFGAATGIPIVGNGKGQSTLSSVLGRVNYNYDQRYFFTASYRVDGSSKFSRNNKWAYFPSAAFSWNIKNEGFLKEAKAVDELKLRMSYGKTGNQAISSYATQNKLTPSLYPVNGALTSGFADNQPGNDNLKWETTDQYDAGIDAGFLNNRIGFTVDLYFKRTNDLLQSIIIPGSSGFTSKRVNSGSIENKGLEVSVRGVPVRTKDFSWNTSGNISWNRNKIVALTEGTTQQFAGALDYRASSVPFIQKIGHPIGTLYGRVEVGIYRNEAEVRSVPENAGLTDAAVKALVGEIHYADLNGDGVIDDQDRQIIGDVNPDFFFGFNNDFKYKKFDLNIFINGVVGGDVINMNNTFLGDIGTMYNTTKEVWDNRWTPENWENAQYPKAWTTYTRNFYITKRFFESGTFLRLRNVVLGYTHDFQKFKGVDRVRLYVSATNMLTISKYKGFDADVNAYGDDPARRGVDFGSYPTSKTWNLGVQVTF